MTVVLQTNNSENNKIKKSVSTIATKTGSLRESTSIVNPDGGMIDKECPIHVSNVKIAEGKKAKKKSKKGGKD